MNVHQVVRAADGNPSHQIQLRLLTPGIAGHVRFLDPSDWAIDEPVRFEVLSPVLGITDFPLPDRAVPVYSARYARALTALGGFDHRLYSVQLVNDRQQPIGDGTEFVLFHVRATVDLMDREQSDYDVYPPTDSMLAGQPRVIKKMVLRSDAEPPPCFYLDYATQRGPLVSDAGRAALEAISVRGVDFITLPTASAPPKLA